MTEGLIDLTTVQVFRLFLLFKRAEALQLADGRERWAIRIHGRGYTRLLQDDAFPAGAGVFGRQYREPMARTFPNRATAENFMRHTGLMPRQVGLAMADR